MIIRDYRLDIARILAVIGVITIHVTDDLVGRINYFGGFSWWISNFLNSFSRTAVPIFIIISGYLLLDRNYIITEKSNFIFKRLKRVGLPLVFWIIFYLSWHVLWFGEIISVNNILDSLLTTKVYHLYFLFIITELYLLTPFIKKRLSQKGNKYFKQITVIFLSAAVVGNLVTYLFKSTILINNIFLISFFYLGYYLFGGYVKSINLDLSKNNSLFSAIALLLLTLFTSVATFFNMANLHKGVNLFFWSEKQGQYFYDNLSINILVMSLIYFLLIKNIFIAKFKNDILIKSVVFLSKTTFGIYLIHPLIMDLLNHYANLDIHNLTSPLWFYISLKIALVTLISLLAVAMISRIPLLKLIVGE